MSGWIKLHRKITKWEWYQDGNVFRVFLHLLLTANTEDKKWKGIDIKRGQVVVGIASLSERLGISTQSIRTCIDKLIKAGDINKQTTNRYTLITVCKYDDYQGGKDDEIDELTNQQ